MTEEADRELQLSRPSERTASGRREREREKGDRRREVETERRERWVFFHGAETERAPRRKRDVTVTGVAVE